MKRLILTTSLLVVAVPGVASAQLSHSQTVAYGRAYAHVVHVFGMHTAGCKLIGPRSTCHGAATDGRILASTDVLHRMFAPDPPPAPPVHVVSYTHAASDSNVSHVRYHVGYSHSYLHHSYSPPAPVSASPSGGLAQCIITRESGGNSQAVNPNGHYGIAQWDVQTWQAQGGGRYSSTPLGASRSQQIAVLNQALASGQSGAWTPYDGC